VIIFFENGRLGNQLFQYCGLRRHFPEHKLLFFGCEDLERHFDSVDGRFISKSVIYRWLPFGLPFGLLRRIVFFLVAARVFGRITEEIDGEVFRLAVRGGLIWNIYVPQDIYFQHRDDVAKIKFTPHLKSELIRVAHDWLKEKRINSKSSLLIFVHVRRRDYLNWPSREFPAALDLAWYQRAIKSTQGKITNPVFIIMGDDQFYLRDVFEESVGLIISDNPPEVDMALMSICHSGILSASSFAWWGAFFARANQRHEGTFVAPLYWGGHRIKKWFPTDFITDWITYQE
jgi:hypothetical protein